MQKSKMLDHLPRYYQGYDVDILIEKKDKKEPLSEDESKALIAVIEKTNKARYEAFKKEYQEDMKKPSKLKRFSVPYVDKLCNFPDSFHERKRTGNS